MTLHEFNKTIEINPNEAFTYIQKARIWCLMNNFKSSEETLNQDKNKCVSVYYRKYCALVFVGKMIKILNIFRKSQINMVIANIFLKFACQDKIKKIKYLHIN